MKLDEIYSPIKKDLQLMEVELKRQLLAAKNTFILEINRHLLNSPGKRLRPSLVLLSSRIGNHWDEKAIPVAAAIELIHTATLVHDDVLDGASIRRNEATLNARWDDKSAVLTGDYLYFKAISLLAELEIPQILSVISSTTGQIWEGEVIQTQRCYDLYLSEKDYLRIIKKKTASFMSACCQVGATLARMAPEARKGLTSYGLNFGMAFQIIDDCLDLTALPDKTGKSTYKDIEQGKMTLPLIYLVRRASKKDRRGLTNLFDRDREEVIDLLKRYETISFSLQRAKEYVIKAKAQLKTVEDSEAGEALWQLGDYLLERAA
ncbi:MAG: polyprenyl synthetase family protein [bacterium]